ncbi:MAG: hypothetical protein HZB29_14155 [Nitrospinae bacterium]|nr:hypothetical protein [Nitrospinota bacterium]
MIKVALKAILILIPLSFFTWGIFSHSVAGVEYESDPEMRGDFWKGRHAVVINGKSSAIPIQLPGVQDIWAGSNQNEIVLPKPFDGETVMAIYFLDSHESAPPTLAIFAGKELAATIQTKPGSGKDTWYKYDQFSDSATITIPASLMRGAENIKIKNISGSWVAIDRIRFTMPTPLWKWGLTAIGWAYFLWCAFKTVRRGAVYAAPTTRESSLLAVTYAAFALSGFSALVYQVSWQRMLGLFSGSDSVSSAIIVGSFLLGLGLGSYAASKFSDRLSNKAAFLMFAMCETLIAAFGFASKSIFYDFLFGRIVSLSGSYPIIFLIVFSLLLAPTFMMGLSLPLLSKAAVRDMESAPSRIGWLYGANTLGAGIGAFAAGFYLIGTFGYEAAIWIAGIVNLTSGFAVVTISILKLVPASAGEAREVAAAETRSITKTVPAVREWIFLFFLSGFIAISLEVVWLRMLGAMFHSSAYGFSLILGIFLIGDAAGIIAGAYIVGGIKTPKSLFIEIQGAVALYAVISMLSIYYLYDNDPAFIFLNENTRMALRPVNLAVISIMTLIVVFPPAALMGLSFPIVQSAVQNDRSLIGNRVGILQLSNIMGNACGSIGAGLVVFWLWGSPAAIKMICLLALLLMASLIYMSWLHPVGRYIKARRALVMGGIAAAALAFPNLRDFWSVLITSDKGACLVEADHTGASALCPNRSGGNTLYTGGKSQGYLPFSSDHVFYSVMGPLIHPDPEKVLVIGLGTGAQAYTLGLNPETKIIDVVEIVNPVYGVLRKSVSMENGRGVGLLFSDPRYNFKTGDGRRALFTSDVKYDIIQTDAIVPVEANSGMLFSREYFTQIKNKLTEDGIAIQWLPTKRSADTFISVFPNVVQIYDLMVGSKNPVSFDMAKLISAVEQGDVRGYLEKGGVNINELLIMLKNSPVNIYDEKSRHQIPSVNTDMFPKDEFYMNTPYRG